ncbi:MAG: UDP-N-acetylmuramoyl-tripeptide--D-alanyl-D-alanine ligase [Betaproteobacteria bacterium]|nr:MAG: UDP-N-acetylmuramoyl-tripeptide--D-alanyl-D-alanine ligase [Betaproteobacteria bacterium]
MTVMHLSEAARAISARLRGEDRAFEAVSTDTRALAPRALFVALKGERFDGHDFLLQAAKQRAAGALVQDPGSEIQDKSGALPLLIVGNTRLALGQLAAYWRSKFSLPLVALTGSNGKTTVKEMLASILRETATAESRAADPESGVLATRGNLNNDIGVPLTLLELRADHRYAVVEMGMNHAGEIRYLARLAAPDVALVNNVGPAHIEFFGSVEEIARAKGEIFEGLGPEGTAVINADDRYAPILRELAAARKRIEFGLESQAAVTAAYKLRFLDSEIVLKTPLGEAAAILKAPGLHNVRNALAASAAAVALKVPAATIAAGLGRFAGVKGRLQYRAAVNGATLIDDTYNANPESARAALAVLGRAPGEKLLVLGDMGELGTDAAALHTEIGNAARALGVDRVYTLGELSAHAARAFGTGARHFDRLEDLLAEIEHRLAPSVTVLVKGSRFMRMERIVRAFALEGEATGEKREGARP